MRDPTYRQAMSYRPLPLAKLLRGLPLKADEVIEASQPTASSRCCLLTSSLASTTLLRFPTSPSSQWTSLGLLSRARPSALSPSTSSGSIRRRPAYAASSAYAVASVRSAEPPARRWPALAIDEALPAVRTGQSLFHRAVVGHTLNGAREC